MPIFVICPVCSTKLSAPDTAAGKKIKCPKCQSVSPVPASEVPEFDVVEDSGPPPKVEKATSKASAGVDDRGRGRKALETDERDVRRRAKRREATDDDEGYVRPRKRRVRDDEEQARGSSRLLIGAIVGGTLLAAMGFGAYWFGFRGKPSGGDDRDSGYAVSTENWETYSSPGKVFKASFPGKPESRGEFRPIGGGKVFSEIRHRTISSGQAEKMEFTVFAGFVRFADDVSDAEVENAKKWLITLYAAPPTFATRAPLPKSITENGRMWEEILFDAHQGGVGLVSWHRAGPILYLCGYRNKLQALPREAIEKFLASYEILGGDPGDPDPDTLKLRDLESYTSPDDAFKASFPGPTRKKQDVAVRNAKETEFREYLAKDEKSGQSRTYFAGYFRFAKKPTYQEVSEVKSSLRAVVYGEYVKSRRVAVGGWPWGEEQRVMRSLSGGTGRAVGIVRFVEAGSAVYVAGIKCTGHFPRDDEIEKFMSSFEILEAKPGKSDLDMPAQWAEYRHANPEFRVAMPRNVHRKEDPFFTGNKFYGVPIQSLTEYEAYDLGLKLRVYVLRFDPNTTEKDRETVLDHLAGHWKQGDVKPTLLTRTKIPWAGPDAFEHTYADGVRVVRQTHDAKVGYVAVACADSEGMMSPEIIRLFLSSFSLDRGLDNGTAPQADTPMAWTSLKPLKGGFEALMPAKRQVPKFNIPPAQKSVVASMKTYQATESGHVFTIHLIQFAPSSPEADRLKSMNIWTMSSVLVPRLKTNREGQTTVKWSGRDAIETTYSPPGACIARQTITGDFAVFASVCAKTGTLDPERVRKFLESFKFDEE